MREASDAHVDRESNYGSGVSAIAVAIQTQIMFEPPVYSSNFLRWMAPQRNYLDFVPVKGFTEGCSFS